MLQTDVEHVQMEPPVTVMSLAGELDASSYLEVIAQAGDLYAAGTRDLLFDLHDLSFMSSSGLVTLHSITLIMRGETLPDMESGWEVLRAIGRGVDTHDAVELHFKLLGPQPRIRQALTTTGFDRVLAIFDDREAALASFGAAAT